MNDKRGFSTLEILTIIVISSIVMICGLVIAFGAKKSGEMKKFQDKASEIVGVAKQAFNDFEREEKIGYMSTVGNSKGMCITLNGLKKNDYYSGELGDYDGYVVIEKQNDKITYTLWMTNKKFVVDGIDSEKIATAKKNKLIKDYEDQSFSSKVKESFQGINATYSNACVDDKVE